VKKIIILTILLILLIYVVLRAVSFMTSPRNSNFLLWLRGDSADRESLVTVQRDKCEGAPFILPVDGYIGLLYEDPRGPYSAFNPHQGIDIFSNAEPGITPVYAAYDAYLTREPDWKSAVILRVPDDPLNPGTQIWLFYTHMADREGNSFILDSFPPGTSEMFVQQGTLLGHTGDYNGNSPRSIWVHLHFSIVKDDGNGRYTNELEINNTLDPSPYLGINLNYTCTETASGCTADPTCP
jgi:murein DD-endopeptidase MepM/ murein hydrolase activator NlpD